MEYSFLAIAKYPNFTDTGKAVHPPLAFSLSHSPNTLQTM